MKQLPVVWEPLNCLYVHINKTNGKKYFGITSQNPRQRWSKGKGYPKSQVVFYNAIQKYGWNGFYHIIILRNLSRQLACELERYFISKYKTTESKYGYNVSLGGDHPKISEKTKQKMKNSSPFKRQIICLETKQIYESIIEASRQLKVDPSGLRSSCLNNGLNKTCKNLHFMFLNEYKQANQKEILDKLNQKFNHYGKPVICVETKIIYAHAYEASEKTNIQKGNIKSCCRGYKWNKTAGGYHWLYYEDYLNKSEVEIKQLLQTKAERGKKRKVFCITTNKLYNSVKEASKEEIVSVDRIIKACKTGKAVNKKLWKYMEGNYGKNFV